MAFYDDMRNMAIGLITKFGGPIQLVKPDEIKYNPVTKKQIQKTSSYPGKGVMRPYTADMIGSLTTMINAGDVQFKITMNDISVIPKEGVDSIIFNSIKYNILGVDTIDPSGEKVVVYTLHCRRAN